MKPPIASTFLFVGLALTPVVRAQVEALDPSSKCLMLMRDDPQAQVLWSKMPFDVSKGQPLEILASNDKPTPDEKAALSFVATQWQSCLDLGEAWRHRNYPAEVNALLTTYRTDGLLALADLYGGKITYGEMARIRAKLSTDLKNNVDAVVAKTTAQREDDARHVQELAAARNEADRQAQMQADIQRQSALRQAALEMLSRPAYQVPLYQIPIQKTTITNCLVAPGSVNCTTH